jgi:hypothetical protein
VQAVSESGGRGFLQRLDRIIEVQAIKPSHRADAVTLPDRRGQPRDLSAGGVEDLLLGQDTRRLAGFAPRGSVLGIGDAKVGAILSAPVLGDLPLAVEEDHAILVGADLQSAAQQRCGRRVAIAVDVNEPFEIDHAAFHRVDVGYVGRQRAQAWTLGAQKLDGACAQTLAKFTADALAPGARLHVESSQSVKVRPARKLCSK